MDKTRYNYNGAYDDEIQKLMREKGWGYWRIYHDIKRRYFDLDISIATIQRRVRAFRKGE
jgi:hypothetical protein